jgi:gliding motility-associated-like protein
MLTAESAGCGTVNENIAFDVQAISINYNTPSAQCENNNLFTLNPTVQLNSGSVNSVYYNWGDQTVGNSLPSTHSYTTAGSYPIKFKVITTAGCIDSIVDTLKVLPISKTLIEKSICDGASFQGYTTAGDHNQIFTAANGCDSIHTIRLTILPTPIINIRTTQSGSVPPYIVSFSCDLTPNIAGTYLWNFGDNSPYEYGLHPNHYYADSGNYNVRLIFTSINGCADTTVARLWINGIGDIFVPNAFTPNGDGLNDLLTVFGTNLEEFKMQIYNRWGELVFQSDKLTYKWNGRKMNTGDMCENANYVFVIFAKPKSRVKKLLKGNVLLIR